MRTTAVRPPSPQCTAHPRQPSWPPGTLRGGCDCSLTRARVPGQSSSRKDFCLKAKSRWFATSGKTIFWLQGGGKEQYLSLSSTNAKLLYFKKHVIVMVKPDIIHSKSEDPDPNDPAKNLNFPQICPKMPHNGPKMTQNGPKWPKYDPKWPKMALE